MKISTLCVHIFTQFPAMQHLFVSFFSSIGNFFAKLTAVSFKAMFRLQWSANIPENFDHRIDLYHQWQTSKNPLWVERGVFNVVALQMFSEPITVELCCGDGFYAKYFYSISSKEIFPCRCNAMYRYSSPKNSSVSQETPISSCSRIASLSIP